MSGASYVHNLIDGNLFFELKSRMRGRACRPLFTDIRLRDAASTAYTYPDLTVICGEPQFADDAFDTILNPVVIIEVPSPWMESWDRGGKFAKYRKLETLRESILVSQDNILFERFTRQADEWVLRTWEKETDSLQLDSIACQIALRAIYENVTRA